MSKAVDEALKALEVAVRNDQRGSLDHVTHVFGCPIYKIPLLMDFFMMHTGKVPGEITEEDIPFDR